MARESNPNLLRQAARDEDEDEDEGRVSLTTGPSPIGWERVAVAREMESGAELRAALQEQRPDAIYHMRPTGEQRVYIVHADANGGQRAKAKYRQQPAFVFVNRRSREPDSFAELGRDILNGVFGYGLSRIPRRHFRRAQGAQHVAISDQHQVWALRWDSNAQRFWHGGKTRAVLFSERLSAPLRTGGRCEMILRLIPG